MCMPRGAGGMKDSGYIDTTPKKHIKKVSKDIFEKGDPDFVDERIPKTEQTKGKKS